MTRLRTLVVALGLLGASAAPAHAGGIYTAFFAGEEGHVVTDHPSASYYNPAGLALRGGTRFVAEGTFGYRFVTYDRPTDAIDNPGTGTPNDALGTNAGKAELNNPLAIPFAAVATDLGVRNLGLGVSLSVPFGGSADWGKNDDYAGNLTYPGAVDGVQRWSIINGTDQAIYVSPAAAYYFPKAHLAVGAGLNVVIQSVNVLRARNVASTDDEVSSNGTFIEGRALIDVKKTELSASAGLIFQPNQRLRLGVSYQSQPGFHNSTLSGTLESKIGRDPTAAPLDVEFTHPLPDIFRVGGSYWMNPRWQVRAELNYQRWSVVERQCVLDATKETRSCSINPDGSQATPDANVTANLDRQWSDGIGLHIGGTYRATEAVQVMAGVTYDTNVVPDATLDAAYVDSDKLLLTLQGRFELGKGLSLSARWLQVVFADRTTDKVEPAMSPTRVPATFGTYKQSVGLFTFAAEYEF